MLRYELYHCQITHLGSLSSPVHFMFRLFFWLGDMPVYPAAVASAELPGSHATLALFSFIPSNGQVHRGPNVVTSASLSFPLANIKCTTTQIHPFPCDVIFTTVQTGALAARLNTEILFKFGFACLFIHTNSLGTTISYEDTPSYLHINLLIEHSREATWKPLFFHARRLWWFCSYHF